jgi:2-polyprenyl-3-methyl-5-hydroxy-6-metoxy-1,4-benzoquinol methylase
MSMPTMRETASRRVRDFVRDLLPETVLNSKVAARATRTSRTLRGVAETTRIVRTLAELDERLEFLARAATVSDDELRRGFSTFRMELDLQMPDDPYSEEYHRKVFDLYEWLHGKPYAPSNEFTLFEVARYTDVPFPYATQSGATVGNYLIGVGHVIRTLNLPPKSRILEFGPGWGNTTLALAQMGHHVTAIDIGQNFVDLINARAAKMNTQVEAIVGDFSMIGDLDGTYDAVLFFECFHHCANHLDLLAGLNRVVAPSGRVIFAGEPISKTMSVPWGLRMDGESLWAIRTNGWLELGFRRSYFLQTLKRYGWEAERVNCPETPSGEIFVARRQCET